MDKKEVYKNTLTVIERLSVLDLDNAEISDYNKRYIREYCNNVRFYASLYSQLLIKSLRKLNQPIHQSTFVDYGGGFGLLSFVAKSIGFKTVVYNDIYQVSVGDAQKIAKILNLEIDLFVCGEIEYVQEKLKQHKIIPDVICSFNVLEHIYNLEDWFQKLKDFKTPFSLYFMTSANGANPYVRRRLQKIHRHAEFIDKKRKFGWKERDTSLAFLDVRKSIIAEYDSNLDTESIDFLAMRTRGLKKEDIIEVVKEYKKTKKVTYALPYLTNTCDPNTGNWAENVIDTKALKKMLEDTDTKVRYTSSEYGYTDNKTLTFAKIFINSVIRLVGEENLFFSATYTLELDFKKE